MKGQWMKGGKTYLRMALTSVPCDCFKPYFPEVWPEHDRVWSIGYDALGSIRRVDTNLELVDDRAVAIAALRPFRLDHYICDVREPGLIRHRADKYIFSRPCPFPKLPRELDYTNWRLCLTKSKLGYSCNRIHHINFSNSLLAESRLYPLAKFNERWKGRFSTP
jgi:hypothetical protein